MCLCNIFALLKIHVNPAAQEYICEFVKARTTLSESEQE